MRAATLFSGIGAPECASPHWDWRFAAEIDKFPAAIHAHHFPATPNLGDVTARDFVERARGCGSIDVPIFGSPCQSFSIAGKRLGLDDPRGNLALVALEIARQLRPRWLVFENVPGLLSSDGGRDYGRFLWLMEQCGYLGAWRILDAQFAGVPQRRRRIFFVGYLGDWRPPVAVLLERESLRRDSPPGREAREDIAGAISARTKGGGGLGTDFECDGGLIASTGDISHCLNAGGGRRYDYESETLLAFDTTQITSKANRSNPQAGDACHPLAAGGHAPAVAFSAKDYGADAMAELAPTLRAGGHLNSHANAGVMPAVAFNLRGREGGSLPEAADLASIRAASGGSSRSYVAHTLSANGFDASEDGTGRGTPIVPLAFNPQSGGDCRGPDLSAVSCALQRSQTAGVLDRRAVRRLTPRECERLQGFADDWTAITYRGKPAKDGPRYKSLGNSMAVPVIKWILDRIEMFTRLGLGPPPAPAPRTARRMKRKAPQAGQDRRSPPPRSRRRRRGQMSGPGAAGRE